jgi:hypothetical protein
MHEQRSHSRPHPLWAVLFFTSGIVLLWNILGYAVGGRFDQVPAIALSAVALAFSGYQIWRARHRPTEVAPSLARIASLTAAVVIPTVAYVLLPYVLPLVIGLIVVWLLLLLLLAFLAPDR